MIKREIRIAPKDVEASMRCSLFVHKTTFVSPPKGTHHVGLTVENADLQKNAQTSIKMIWNLQKPVTPITKNPETEKFLKPI